MDTFKDYIQDMDCITLWIFCVPIVSAICGILVLKKSRRNMQHTSRNIKSQFSKKFTRNRIGKQHKPESSSSKSLNSKNNNTTKKTNHNHVNLSNLTIKNWLHNGAYCYEEGSFIKTSSFKSNVNSRYVLENQNCISNENCASKELNSYSSSEDLPLTTLKSSKQLKQQPILRPKRQQKRKQDVELLNIKKVHPLEINETYVKSRGLKQTSSNAGLSLRKRCTEGAALKRALNNNTILNMFNYDHRKVESSLSTSSLSTASSTTSLNSSVTSSHSNSPTHSVNSSPTSSPTVSKRNTEHMQNRSFVSSLKQFTKLNMNEQELVTQMKRYVIDPSLLKIYGFPVESIYHEGCIEIYKCLPKHLAEEAVTKDNQRHYRHFYGRRKCDVINESDGLYYSSWDKKSHSCSSTDSGHGSGESSRRLSDSDSEMVEEDSILPIMAFYTPDGVYQIFLNYCNSVEKQCVRCFKMFQINEKGDYLSFDSCAYHYGKLTNVYDGKFFINIYSCCQGEELSEGCSKYPLHVWNGTVMGVNGPYTGFLHTQNKKSNHHKRKKIYAIDCEMSYTGLGLEVTKVTVVSFNGSLVYEHFVKPQSKIIDYNTRYSGVSEKDFLPYSNKVIKTLEEVQKDLLNLFDADTILIGHGLDNDLKALRLVHKTIVDTSIIFSHSTGFPYRRSLKNLTKTFLKRDIQCSAMGHNSLEDSRACLELMMWKIRKDLRHWSYQ